MILEKQHKIMVIEGSDLCKTIVKTKTKHLSETQNNNIRVLLKVKTPIAPSCLWFLTEPVFQKLSFEWNMKMGPSTL